MKNTWQTCLLRRKLLFVLVSINCETIIYRKYNIQYNLHVVQLYHQSLIKEDLWNWIMGFDEAS